MSHGNIEVEILSSSVYTKLSRCLPSIIWPLYPQWKKLMDSSMHSISMSGKVLVAVDRLAAAVGWIEWWERETHRDSITSQLQLVSTYLCNQIVSAIQTDSPSGFYVQYVAVWFIVFLYLKCKYRPHFMSYFLPLYFCCWYVQLLSDISPWSWYNSENLETCRLWMERPALLTPRLCAFRENASKQAAMESWTRTKSLTSAACVVGTTRAVRRSQECSPNLCK